MNVKDSDVSLAHAPLRLGLDVNILMHGVSRLPDLAGFSRHLEQTISKTWLPLPRLTATGYRPRNLRRSE